MCCLFLHGDSMKHIISVVPFTFNKIADKSKRFDIRLFDKKIQQIRLNDTIEYVNIDTHEKIWCVVRGIAMFENFDSLIDVVPPQLIGYDNQEEIRIRINRLYAADEQKEFFACGLFIEEMELNLREKFRYLER